MTLNRDETRQIPIAAPQVGTREKDAVEDVLDSGHLAHGDVVRQFEAEFADYCGADHAVGVANGTAALHAALAGLGIGEGDTVVTTPFTFVATANAVRFTGAEPVFADIDPETYNLDPDAVRETIDDLDGDVDAILVVHLYGLPAAMGRLADVAEAYDVPLVEDAAQAHGAEHEGRRVGAIGDVGCFSFYPTKNMTTGEGGMVVTDRPGLAERVRTFIDHGRAGTYQHVTVGHNFRMSNVAAALGRVQLDRLPDYVEARRSNAERLTAGLADSSLTTPVEPEGTRHAFNQYTVRTDQRGELADHLDEFGIDTGVYYPTPVHGQPAYQDAECTTPVAERAARAVISLPVHPQLEPEDLDTILTAIDYFDTYGE
ncbi:DegT/DnrJ/EryC1/StrS family aminotransferase [Halobacteriales archaeon Cl-PHB]